MRRAAAEALAKHKKEGYPVLKEGAELEDILVRRAVVFGLARVHEPWAKELLEKIQIDDSEWVVRNAAGQTLDDLQKGSSAIPSILPGLHETPWLITFASEKGVGIAEGQSSWDMLEKAIKEGSEEQKLSAMEIYRQKPTKAKSVLAELYEMTNGLDEEIREAAYNTIWHIGGSGIELPPMN
ncbi:MAG: HEAT repeat domain-containing protein [Chloroflexota bacterium]